MTLIQQDAINRHGNVYGRAIDLVRIPKGWRFVEFRSVRLFDYFLTEDGRDGYQDGGVNFSCRSNPDDRRVIIELVKP